MQYIAKRGITTSFFSFAVLPTWYCTRIGGLAASTYSTVKLPIVSAYAIVSTYISIILNLLNNLLRFFLLCIDIFYTFPRAVRCRVCAIFNHLKLVLFPAVSSLQAVSFFITTFFLFCPFSYLYGSNNKKIKKPLKEIRKKQQRKSLDMCNCLRDLFCVSGWSLVPQTVSQRRGKQLDDMMFATFHKCQMMNTDYGCAN